jgi:acyl-CoA hydrolase
MKPLKLSKISQATDYIFEQLGHTVNVAAPLGLGKPNQLLNEIYDRACTNPNLRLKIYTALSLQPPIAKEDLARRFLAPFAARQWGDNYPVLKYSRDALADRIPANVQVHEFYLQAGSALRSHHLQRHYQSINYTHVAESLVRGDANVIVQMIAKRDGKYSLSCNPDVTLDVADLFHQAQKKIIIVGVVHPDLPFLAGDAEVAADFFDVIVESQEVTHQLFALPRVPISPEDHLIGFYASQLVRDGGTIQIGIGSLSDAIVAALCIRQKENSLYQSIRAALRNLPHGQWESFVTGLYGLTEMLTDGFMYLRQAGILTREVVDESTGHKTFLHGSFILGSKPFYRWMRELPADEADGLRMTRVSKVNDLYDPNEMAIRRQRVKAHFFNTTMQVTLLGEAMSETLPTASVVSGVGGQYNFVAMSYELKDSVSVMMLRSSRLGPHGKKISNILWEPGHVTIPRHLRDIVITEYGVAYLKGKTDEECIKALLNITDSEFQGALLEKAKAAGKIALGFEIPEEFRQNTSEKLHHLFVREEFRRAFPPFPFGSDFTKEEENLSLALSELQDDQKISLMRVLKRTFFGPTAGAGEFTAELDRMGLKQPRTLKERIYQ